MEKKCDDYPPDIPRHPPEVEVDEDQHEPDDPGPPDHEDQCEPDHTEIQADENQQAVRGKPSKTWYEYKLRISGRRRSKLSHLSIEEKRERVKEKDRKRKAEKLAAEKPEKRKVRLQKIVEKRANETNEEHELRLKKDAERHVKKRAAETAEQTATRNIQNAARMVNVRADQH